MREFVRELTEDLREHAAEYGWPMTILGCLVCLFIGLAVLSIPFAIPFIR